MPTVELAKSIEARKLNRRTGRPVDTLWLTVPFGAILENVVEKGDLVEFSYLGELYHCRRGDIPTFLTAAPAAPGEACVESVAAGRASRTLAAMGETQIGLWRRTTDEGPWRMADFNGSRQLRRLSVLP
jgi:hypothetical protein